MNFCKAPVMNVSELKTYFSEDFIEETRLLSLPPEQEQQVQDYLQGIAQRLIGDEWDFETFPVYFAVSDNASPNAAFCPNPRYEMKDGEYVKDKRGDKIPLKTVPMIFVTKGLLEYVKNEDELAFILGHELGHFRQQVLRGNHQNTKIEEASSDYVSLDMLARAGYSLASARDVAARIFRDETANGELSAILTQALDAHPNNQSRMNFIDVSIVEKTKKLRKQDIDVRNVEASPIASAVKETIAQSRHIPFVESFLQEHGYAELDWEKRLNVLDDCIAASERWYKGANDWSPRFHINVPRQRDIRREFARIVSEMREQLPRRLIKQSDFELCGSNKYDLNEEQRGRRKRLLAEMNMDGWDTSRIKQELTLYPNKIVPDGEFEQAEKENEALRRREIAELAAGRQANQSLFAYAYQNVPHDGGFTTTHPDRETLYWDVVRPSLYNLEPIPLNDNWPLASKIRGYAENYLNEGNFESGRRLVRLAYLRGNNDSDLTDKDKSLAALPNIGVNYLQREFHDVFNGLPLPEFSESAADINKKVPVSWRKTEQDLKDVLGIACDCEISDDEWVLSYYDPRRPEKKEDKSYYIVNAEGVITAYYPAEQYQQLIADIRKKTEDSIYNQLAANIRADKKMVEDFVANPDISRVSFKDLERMKWLTSFSAKSFPGLTFVLKQDDFARAAELESLYYSAEAEYHKRKVTDLYSDDFYRLRDSSPYRLARDMYIAEEKIREYLTPEEFQWFNAYNHAVDMAVFKGLTAKLRHLAAHEKKSVVDEYPLRVDFSLDSNFRYRDFSDMRHHSISGSYSLAQVHEVVRTVLDGFALDKNLEFINCKEKIWRRMRLLDDYRLYHLEMRHLYAYIETHGGEKKVDYHDYRPLFMDRLQPLLDIAPFDIRHPEIMREQIRISEPYDKDHQYENREWLLHFEALRGILVTDDTDYPLAAVAPLLKNTAFVPAVAAKLEPVLVKAGNWPADLAEAADLAQTFQHENLMNNPAAVVETFIEMFIRETDAEKLEKALLALSPVLNDNKIPVAKQNELKDRLIKAALPLWRQELEDRLNTFSALSKANVFSADMVVQNRLLESFVPQIENIADAGNRSRHYMHFLLKANRIDDPEIRRRYQHLWVNSVFSAVGSRYDDNSADYHNRLAPFVAAVKHITVEKSEWGEEKRKEDVAAVDRFEILRMLADKVVSQQALSQYIKPEPSGIDAMEAGNLTEGNGMGIAFELVKGYMNRDSRNPAEVITFLLSDGSRAECEAFYQKLLAYAPSQRYVNKFFVEKVQKEANPEKLSVLYREFWGYPLEARAVLINELLHSQVSHASGEKWENIFNIVADRVFPNAESEMSRLGKEFLRSYIKSRADEERTLYLSAMMVAANGNSAAANPEKSIARGIRLFLENSGPAAIKLGQAMASYPDVPKFIRDEMQELKSNAARPSRWEIYEWLDFYKRQNPGENLEYGKEVWLGRILGSASYFVTLEKGRFAGDKIPAATDKVIKILRAGAEIDSAGEFKVFEKMLYDLGAKGVMKNGLDTFLRLVRQARDSVEVETNTDIGYQQLQTAQKIYPQAVRVNGRSFGIHVADWSARGKNWAELERAQGLDLDQIKDAAYRKDFSKAYFTVEMVNMLSGGRFDHDRHGKQLKIDVATDTIGLFDTGAMAVVDPAPEDKELLGRILSRTAQDILSGAEGASFAKVGETLSAKIEEAYHNGETQNSYLTEFQRGLLALNDFYKDFGAEDFIECFNSALNNPDLPLDRQIMSGFIKESVGAIGLFSARQNLLSHQDKEQVGRLLFNVYAISLNGNGASIKDVVLNEIAAGEKGGNDIPVLKVIKAALTEKSENRSLGLSLPPQFIPSLDEVIGTQNIDIAIVKGMMKEAVYALNLQEQKDAYSAEERQNFGRTLYRTFRIMLEDKKCHRRQDIAAAYRRAVKETPASAYANKVLAVINLAEERGNAEQNGESRALIKEMLLSGHMDKEVANGIALALREQNPDSNVRRFVAQGIKFFLTQEKPQPGLLKKALVRMFVKKQPVRLEEQISVLAENQEVNRKFVQALQGYVKTAAEKINQIKAKPQINLVTSANLGKIAVK